MNQVYIVSAVRTPMGSFGGKLRSFSSIDLGRIAIEGAVNKCGLSANQIDEVIMGNVCSANLGQAPARQAALGAGIPNTVPCTTVNKVCSSGMKSIMFAAQSILLGHIDVALAGGMESMSNVPFYAPDQRWGKKYGHSRLIDGLQRDGLSDAYDHRAMGDSGDATAKKYGFTREAQDNYAIASYRRAAQATEAGKFENEIVPVSIPQKRSEDLIMSEDEEYKNVVFEKIPKLRPAFNQDGTVTAANASTLNDGASAVILVAEKMLKKYNLKPLARIVSFADAAHQPEWFTTAPVKAVPRALARANLKVEDVGLFEVNEAFAVVPMAFASELGVDHERMNVHGGAVSLGHPLGCSGARITTTLVHALHDRDKRYGCATLCNGGGGASAIVLERIEN